LIISYIKSGNLNACLFKEFYKDMTSTHALFYSTRLYAGYRKQTYQTAFLWWNEVIPRTESKRVVVLH